MSKSLGNVVSPEQMMAILGTDGLRLWVSSIDCSGEAVISDTLNRNVQEVFRKIRNTCRFLLSNLYDFDIEKDAIAPERMRMIDQYALQRLHEVNTAILDKYQQYDFTAIFHALADYCATDLSSFYLDIIKDRLYVEQADGLERRSAQTACWHILDTLTRLIAPILSFTAEQISDLYQKNKRESIHLQSFKRVEAVWKKDALQLMQQWSALKQLRSALLKAIELVREQGLIKHSLEARLRIFIARDHPNTESIVDFMTRLEQHGQQPYNFFKEFMIVSQVAFMPTAEGLVESEFPGLWVAVEQAEGTKCPRCWQWEHTLDPQGLCARCRVIVDRR
jgi:isoleucyl-tRNA synthetase